MVVVPAFAKGENRDPETVRGLVPGFVTLRTPHMRGGIDQPGGVQTDDNTHKHPPEDPGPATDSVEDEAKQNRRHDVPLADPQMKLVLAKIGDIGKKFG